jgi:hypothetical protein
LTGYSVSIRTIERRREEDWSMTTANGPTRTKRVLESSEEKPLVLPVNPDGIPIDLKEPSNWVCWRSDHRQRKWTKVPINPHTGGNADSTNPTTRIIFFRRQSSETINQEGSAARSRPRRGDIG